MANIEQQWLILDGRSGNVWRRRISDGHKPSKPLWEIGYIIFTLSFRFWVESDTRTVLAAIAAGLDRDLSYVLNETITAYLEIHQGMLMQRILLVIMETNGCLPAG